MLNKAQFCTNRMYYSIYSKMVLAICLSSHPAERLTLRESVSKKCCGTGSIVKLPIPSSFGRLGSLPQIEGADISAAYYNLIVLQPCLLGWLGSNRNHIVSRSISFSVPPIQLCPFWCAFVQQFLFELTPVCALR